MLSFIIIIIQVYLSQGLSVHFYTKLSPNNPIYINNNTPNLTIESNTEFEGYLNYTQGSICKTYIIIHGLASSPFDDWVINMKNKLLSTSKFVEVLVLDWSTRTQWSFDLNFGYVAAIRRIRPTALELSEILIQFSELKNLNKDDTFPLNVHCIGHSLGAHCCGHLGKILNSHIHLRLKRITGLDPAGPCFEDYDETNRLSINDADYVDIIHTSVNLGIQKPIGHSDYYVNNARTQPGCYRINEIKFPILWCDDNPQGANRILGNLFNLIKCSHSKAHSYFIESISSKCSKFNAFRCENFDMFKRNECFHCKMNKMGFYSEPEYKDGLMRSYYLYYGIVGDDGFDSLINENINVFYCEPVYLKLYTSMSQIEPYYITPLNINKIETIQGICFESYCNSYILVHGYSMNRSSDWADSLKEELFGNVTQINVYVIDWSEIQKVHERKERSVDYTVSYLNRTIESFVDYLNTSQVSFSCIANDDMAGQICEFLNKVLAVENIEEDKYFEFDENFYCNGNTRLKNCYLCLILFIFQFIV